MATDAIFEERESDWSHQVFAVGTTRWLQCDQTLPLSVKGVACETTSHTVGGGNMFFHEASISAVMFLLPTHFWTWYCLK